uniref:hypothetical protein n=1 Tax=Clostridium sp. NkU-1 TaxID=1095009 RepID=UPI000B114711
MLTGGVMGEEAAQKIASFFEAAKMQGEEILPFMKEQLNQQSASMEVFLTSCVM